MSGFDLALQKAHDLLTIDGVVGVGEGEIGGQRCIVVFVASPSASVRSRLPAQIDGVPVDIRESGPFTAQ